MNRSAAEILREYGPFPGVDHVHGVTYDGQHVWFAAGDKLHAFDPASGKTLRSIDVAAHAGTAFDGQHLFQIAEDRRMLGHILEWYFWLVFTVQEAKLSLKRLRTLLFGAPLTKRKGPPPDRSSGARSHDEELPGEAPLAPDTRAPQAGEPRRPGHGRQSAQAYVGATQVMCHHETLRVGEHCPVCGRGRLYRVPPGVMLRLTGNALVSAVHYALEKLCCSACGQVFTAGARDAGAEKYTASAR